MIRFENATIKFGSLAALDQCTLEIQSREHVAILGPSGAGKSTLLKAINAEYFLDSGHFSIHDLEIAKLDNKTLIALRKSIAYIPQHLALIPNIKVFQNVSLGSVGSESFCQTLKNQVFPDSKRLQSILNILEDVGIPEKLFHRTDGLSGGQQQRVAIARAIFQHAATLLADEPVSAVDPTRAHDLLDCLTTIAHERQMTLICTLHNLEYAKKFFPRLIGMRAGKVVYDGSPNDFTEEEFHKLYNLDYHG